MSNYTTDLQLNKITQSISKIFDIKLSKVRHKVALEEGYKTHEAHIASLPKEQQKLKNFNGKYDISDLNIPSIMDQIKNRTGMFLDNAKSIEVFDIIFKTSVYNFKSNKCTEINVSITEDGYITISDDSKKISPLLFDNSNEKNIFNGLFNGLFYSEDYWDDTISHTYYSIKSFYIVNALSKSFEVKYKNATDSYEYKFKNSVKESTTIIENKSNSDLGLSTRFKIDFTYLEEKKLNIEDILKSISRSVTLNKGLKVNLTLPDNSVFKYEITDNSEILFTDYYVLNSNHINLDVITKTNTKTNASVTAIFVDSLTNEDFSCQSYINDIHTPEGGTHEKGLIDTLTELQVQYCFKKDLKGVKAILLVNDNDYTLSNNMRKLISRDTRKTVYNLLTDKNL